MAAGAPGPSLRLSLALIAVALVIGVPCVVQAVRPLADVFSGSAHAVPGQIRVDLDPGEHFVYLETTGRDVPTPLFPGQVTITSPSGRPVAVRGPGAATQTITRGSDVYTGMVRFTVGEDGEHLIRVATEQPGRAVVAPSLGQTVGRAAGWFAGALAAGLLGALGIVLLIVGMVRRSRAGDAGPPAPGQPSAQWPAQAPAQWPAQSPPQPAMQPASPPAGWYPDPSGAHGRRYWDGTRWTEEVTSP
jgi:hypothetical protein